MTALAMIIGMLPMALGMGEGGEQNAPLGRAVIGGLLVATAFTLLFVPVMYSLLRRKAPKPEVVDDWTDERTVLPSNGHRTEPARAVALATTYAGPAIDEPMQGPVP